MPYAYKRTINLDHTQVPSTQSAFSVLVKLDSSNAGTTMKTVANGGHINNTVTQSGGVPTIMPADLIFTSDSTGSTKVSWDVEFYDGTNGILWAWVYVASLSSSADTPIYMFYDDSSVTTQQNTGIFQPAQVWDPNFQLVYHMSDNAASTTITDSTSHTNNATNQTNTSTKTITGQIDGALNYPTLSDYALSGNITLGNNITVSAWINPASNAMSYGRAMESNFGTGFFLGSSNLAEQFQVLMSDPTALHGVSGLSNFVVGTWYYVVGTLSGTTVELFVNGVSQGTNTTTAPGTVTLPMYINTYYGGPGTFGLTGGMDEIHVANTTRSHDWITTETNNQNNPESFAVVGSETPVSNNPIGPFPTHISL